MHLQFLGDFISSHLSLLVSKKYVYNSGFEPIFAAKGTTIRFHCTACVIIQELGDSGFY